MFLNSSPNVYYDENDLKCILENYDRTLNNILEDIDIIEKWLENQHHLLLKPSKRQILSFLIMNKFSIERTKQKLDFNYTVRNIMPEVYENMLPTAEEVSKARNIITAVPLPKLFNLHRIMYLGLEVSNPNNINVNAFLSYFTHTMEVKTLLDYSLSDDYIVNFNHADLSVISKVGIMDIKRYTIILEKVYSSRIASIHMINVPSYAKFLIETVINFLPKKIRNRTKVHKNVADIGDFFPSQYLPKELGFNGFYLKDIKENWTKVLLEHLPHFEALQNNKVNESLRSEKLLNDDLLGYHGNFRKLQVD